MSTPAGFPGSNLPSRRRFVLENTSLIAPPHVPEIRLYLADEAHDLWLKTEEELQDIGLPPPFWAFAWAGGQGLARYVLDNPHIVRGKNVLDLATGSGLVAIAAAMAGASHVLANDTDPFCEAAVTLNCKVNGVEAEFSPVDFLTDKGTDDIISQFDCILAGDVFYDKAFAAQAAGFLTAAAKAGKTVLAGDPGRAYLPEKDIVKLAEYFVPVTRALEDSEVKRTAIWRFSI